MNERRELLRAFESGLVCFTGAGVSANEPSCLPLSSRMKDTITELVTQPPAVIDALRCINLERDEARMLLERVPLESLIGLLCKATGYSPDTLMSPLSRGLPNQDHFAIAVAMREFGNREILTLNFDSLQEAALVECGLPRVHSVSSLEGFRRNLSTTLLVDEARVWHLHGSLSGGDIATTVESVGLRLPRARFLALRRFVKGRDVFCIGYSDEDSDTAPILAGVARRIFWYLHDHKLPPKMRQVAKSLGERFIVIEPLHGEAGVSDVICATSAAVRSALKGAWKDSKADGSTRDTVEDLRGRFSQALGLRNEREVTCSYVIAAVLDGLGFRRMAHGFLESGVKKWGMSGEQMALVGFLEGHILEREGLTGRARKVFRSKALRSSGRAAKRLAEIRECSAGVGLWKANPALIWHLLRWLVVIRHQPSDGTEARQRVHWQRADILHHLGEVIMVPSSVCIALPNRITGKLERVLGALDLVVVGALGACRRRILRKAARQYLCMIKGASYLRVDPLAGHTALALLRLAEIRAALSVGQVRGPLKERLRESSAFYEWTGTEHGIANATCTKAIVAFYGGKLAEARKCFDLALMQYGSHRSGQIKVKLFKTRLKIWKGRHCGSRAR